MLEEKVMFVTKLSDESRRVLSVILSKGVATGTDLQWATELTAEQLVAAVEPLIQLELIGVSGDPMTPKGILDAYFNLRPSARNTIGQYLSL